RAIGSRGERTPARIALDGERAAAGRVNAYAGDTQRRAKGVGEGYHVSPARGAHLLVSEQDGAGREADRHSRSCRGYALRAARRVVGDGYCPAPHAGRRRGEGHV